MATSGALEQRAIDVIGRVAAVAASGASSEERADEILDELHVIFPFDAAMVVAVEPNAALRRPVAGRQYSEFFRRHLLTDEWHEEIMIPYGFPAGRWPFREVDMPCDPAGIPSLSYGHRDGLKDGLLSTFFTADGRYAGFLIMSWDRNEPPSEQACQVVGQVAPALTNVVDPVQTAKSVLAALGEDCAAIALAPDGGSVALRGTVPAELCEPEGPARQMLERMRRHGTPTASFIWPQSAKRWLGCRLTRCGNGVDLLTARPLADVNGLTARELEVLARLVEGRSNASIAQELWVTVRTVRAHVEHILQKLEVTTRAGAVARALEEGLVPPR